MGNIKSITSFFIFSIVLFLTGCQSEEETRKFLLICKYGEVQHVEAMIKEGIDVNGSISTGITGLMVAAAENRLEIVDLLLKHQATPDLQTRRGTTALMFAAARGSDVKIIERLIEAKSDVNVESKESDTALTFAVSGGQRLADDYVYIRDMRLDEADAEKDPGNRVFDQIVVAAAQKTLATGGSALLTEDMALRIEPGVLKSNTEEIVYALLKSGAEVNAKNSAGETAFYLAAEKGRSLNVLEALKASGADVNVTDKKGTTSLMVASMGYDPQPVQTLISLGLDVNKSDKYGKTALLYAAENNAKDAVLGLVKAGANVNTAAPDGNTALMLAVNKDKKDNVEALISLGADVNAQNQAGMTALGMSTRGEIRQALLDSGASTENYIINMAQNDLNACVIELIDKYTSAGLVQVLSNPSRRTIAVDNDCEGFGRMSIFSIVGPERRPDISFTAAQVTYFGKSLTCELVDYSSKCY